MLERLRFAYDTLDWVVITHGLALTYVFMVCVIPGLITGLWISWREVKREEWNDEYPTRLDFWLTLIFFSTGPTCLIISAIFSFHFNLASSMGLI